MNEVILPFLQRYEKPLAVSEKSSSPRRIFWVANLVNTQILSVGESTYRYLRVLDDLIDEHPSTREAQLVMDEELAGISEGPASELQRSLLEPLKSFTLDRQMAINNQLFILMRGMTTDLRIRYTQQPLTSAEITKRNYGDMEKYGFQFQDGQALPNQQLSGYYNRERWGVTKDLLVNANSIFRIGMPTWMASLVYGYLLNRAFNLANPLVVKDGAIYKAPVDKKEEPLPDLLGAGNGTTYLRLRRSEQLATS